MSFRCGIIGLPNVGKSSLFNALIGVQKAASENYPFCTIEPNIGKVPVPDERLVNLGKINKSKSIVNSQVEFVDIAGLVKGASKGEGLGNKFLSNIREVDAIAHVIRCFENKDITHVHNKVDPIFDIEIIENEILISDIEKTENTLEKLNKLYKNGKNEYLKDINLLKKVLIDLDKGEAFNIRKNYNNEEISKINNIGLISFKPMMYVANLDENAINDGNKYSKEVEISAKNKNVKMVKVSAQLEAELAHISNINERTELMESLNIKKSGLEKFIIEGFSLLKLITFFTSGEKESKAWTVPEGTLAPKAASVIHTDFEKGFISAEVIDYNQLILAGGDKQAKNKGLIRTEGKDYVISDGDVVLFRFNV